MSVTERKLATDIFWSFAKEKSLGSFLLKMMIIPNIQPKEYSCAISYCATGHSSEFITKA